MSANDTQVGGNHYQQQKIQHWDFVAANDLDYFQGQITKYVSRWKNKGGIEDLLKAKHFLEKYIELESAKVVPNDICCGIGIPAYPRCCTALTDGTPTIEESHES